MGSQFYDEPYSCQWIPVFSIFLDIFSSGSGFSVQWKRSFQYPSPAQYKRIFCIVETIYFGQHYFAASRNHYWNKEKTVLRETAHYCQCTTDFLASGNHFFLNFLDTLASDTLVQLKRLFQRNPSFRLMETDFLASGNRFLLIRCFSYKQKQSLNQWRLTFKERL